MKTILLAEDDRFLAEIYTTQLKRAGYRVDWVRDGLQAVAATKETHPDLLIMDLVMTNMDGWEALAEIRKDPAVAGTKVVIISNLNRSGNEENIAKYGVLKYFLKVETPTEEIIDAIGNILNPKPQVQNNAQQPGA